MPIAVVNLTGNNRLENSSHAMGTVTLNWDYVIDSSTPLLGYIVAYMDENNVLETLYVNDVTTSPSHTISGLLNGHSYDFSVIAFNMLGTGASTDINVIPSYVPDAPVANVVHGNHELDLSWNVPNAQGNAITGYNVYRSLDDITYTRISSNQAGLSMANTGLTNGTIYYYKISAINANGEGALSASVNEYPSTIPSSPAGSINVMNSNYSSNGQQLTLSWTEDPVDVSLNGGSMITMFRVTDNLGNLINTVNSQVGSATYTSTIGSLTNGQSYVFRVYTVNRDGVSSSYHASGSAIPSGLPDAPYFGSVNINPLNTAGVGHQIGMSWSVNVATGGNNVHPSDEGNGILSYNIYRDGTLLQNVVGVNNKTFTDSGLVQRSKSYLQYYLCKCKW